MLATPIELDDTYMDSFKVLQEELNKVNLRAEITEGNHYMFVYGGDTLYYMTCNWCAHEEMRPRTVEFNRLLSKEEQNTIIRLVQEFRSRLK